MTTKSTELKKTILAQQGTIRALMQEVEALRKDAERYRWLKQYAFCSVWHRGDGLALVAPRVLQREVDAAIDSAIAAQQQEGQSDE